MQVTSLGYRTDLTLRVLEGSEVADRGDYLVVRSPGNPAHWWGNFLLLAAVPEPGRPRQGPREGRLSAAVGRQRRPGQPADRGGHAHLLRPPGPVGTHPRNLPPHRNKPPPPEP